MIEIHGEAKATTLHDRDGAVIEVMRGAALTAPPGECVTLFGALGTGRATLLRMIGGTRRAASGRVAIVGAAIGEAFQESAARVQLCDREIGGSAVSPERAG